MCRDTGLANTRECSIPGPDGKNSVEKQLVYALRLHYNEMHVSVLWLFL